MLDRLTRRARPRSPGSLRNRLPLTMASRTQASDLLAKACPRTGPSHSSPSRCLAIWPPNRQSRGRNWDATWGTSSSSLDRGSARSPEAIINFLRRVNRRGYETSFNAVKVRKRKENSSMRFLYAAFLPHQSRHLSETKLPLDAGRFRPRPFGKKNFSNEFVDLIRTSPRTPRFLTRIADVVRVSNKKASRSPRARRHSGETEIQFRKTVSSSLSIGILHSQSCPLRLAAMLRCVHDFSSRPLLRCVAPTFRLS